MGFGGVNLAREGLVNGRDLEMTIGDELSSDLYKKLGT